MMTGDSELDSALEHVRVAADAISVELAGIAAARPKDSPLSLRLALAHALALRDQITELMRSPNDDRAVMPP